MVWFIIIVAVLAALIVAAVVRANKTNRLPAAEKKRLRKLMMEVQQIGSPDPKDMPW
jgi:hypothetical protein